MGSRSVGIALLEEQQAAEAHDSADQEIADVHRLFLFESEAVPDGGLDAAGQSDQQNHQRKYSEEDGDDAEDEDEDDENDHYVKMTSNNTSLNGGNAPPFPVLDPPNQFQTKAIIHAPVVASPANSSTSSSPSNEKCVRFSDREHILTTPVPGSRSPLPPAPTSSAKSILKPPEKDSDSNSDTGLSSMHSSSSDDGSTPTYSGLDTLV